LIVATGVYAFGRFYLLLQEGPYTVICDRDCGRFDLMMELHTRHFMGPANGNFFTGRITWRIRTSACFAPVCTLALMLGLAAAAVGFYGVSKKFTIAGDQLMLFFYRN
jgi:hypothetical protein